MGRKRRDPNVATPRERQFVKEYLRTWSAVKAAAACGLKQPHVQGCRVFNRPAVQAYLKERLAKLEIGLGRGKKLYDKRADIAKKDQKREAQRDFKIRNLG